jgi:hypothetical protein
MEPQYIIVIDRKDGRGHLIVTSFEFVDSEIGSIGVGCHGTSLSPKAEVLLFVYPWDTARGRLIERA